MDQSDNARTHAATQNHEKASFAKNRAAHRAKSNVTDAVHMPTTAVTVQSGDNKRNRRRTTAGDADAFCRSASFNAYTSPLANKNAAKLGRRAQRMR